MTHTYRSGETDLLYFPFSSSLLLKHFFPVTIKTRDHASFFCWVWWSYQYITGPTHMHFVAMVNFKAIIISELNIIYLNISCSSVKIIC